MLMLVWMTVIGVVLSVIMFIVNRWVDSKKSIEKEEVYECGFDVFEKSREMNIRFFVVGMLFLLFDLETVILYSWLGGIESIGKKGYIVMIEFIVELVLGYVIVWKRGGLQI